MSEETTNTTTKGDVLAARMLVRLREDFQAMRKRMDNRIGRKASGQWQDIAEREFRREDLSLFAGFADAAHEQEKAIEKELNKVLHRFPIYTEWLSNVKGVGPIAAGWVIAEYDIHKASTVSKLWQFTGLNPGLVTGKKRVENKDGSFSYVPTDSLIPGDRLTPGFVAPFNKRLRTAMVGVLADGILKANMRYRDATDEEYEQRPNTQRRIKKDKEVGDKKQVIDAAGGYSKVYLDYKTRLEQSEKMTLETKKGGKAVEMPWNETKDGHRDRAAKRYMIKMFLKDLYVAWRGLEGLPVRPSYQEEYLGHKHEQGVPQKFTRTKSAVKKAA